MFDTLNKLDTILYVFSKSAKLPVCRNASYIFVRYSGLIFKSLFYIVLCSCMFHPRMFFYLRILVGSSRNKPIKNRKMTTFFSVIYLYFFIIIEHHGTILISIFQQFFASINKILLLGGGL